MHKSRLGGLIIDCETDDLVGAARFWSDALGLALDRQPDDDNYVRLRTAPDDLPLEVQQVGHQSRVHLDIETDDIEAEVARLEALGAKRLKAVRDWVVMEAPTGQRFCVVVPQRASFDDDANVWD
ncbi:MAG: VOC family protein [Rhodospirillales bacterium]